MGYTIGAMKNPACVITSHTWLRSRYRMNMTLAASEKPEMIANSWSMYSAYRPTAVTDGARPVSARNASSTTENSATVMTAFDADVSTITHDGNLAFVSR